MDDRQKRLLFRSQHRGTREADILFGGFAARYVAEFTGPELDRFEILVGQNDADLVDWISGRRPPPPELDSDLMRRLIRYGNDRHR
ncbi:MAG: succinate dehydrogenase assembly factor 2 [Rhodospirillales bacterium]|nr:succinate dehydrogenase assembly factor 2 [Rhodospirillales bacterium]